MNSIVDGADESVLIYEEYNLTNLEDSDRFDKDCADAYNLFRAEGLKYEIRSRHWCTVTDEDRIVDMVSVEWEFWKEIDDEL
jgi:hypothetical protein